MATHTRAIEQPETQATQSERLVSATLLAFVAIVVLLGVNFVAVRLSNRELPPFWGAGLRFGVGALILFGIMAVQRLPLPRDRALLGAVVYGAVLFGANYGLLYWGLLRVPSGMAAVLFATIPLITLLLAVLLRLEQFQRRSALGGVLVLVGIGLAFHEPIRADVPLASLLAVLLAAVCGALSGIVVKAFPKNNPFTANAIGMAVGTAMLLAASAVAGEIPRLPALTETWIALGWLVASAVLAFVLMVWVLSRWSASATSYSTVLIPMVTVVAAAGLAGEQVGLLFLAGGALVLLGVYSGALVNRAESAPPRDAR
jgi:drug/metabolite transporter (DMT)-like permease